MMRIEGSPSNDRPAPGQRRCESCNEPLLSHVLSCPSPPALSPVNQAAALAAFRVAAALGIQRVVRREDGSSWTRRGAGASRSWSVTGSSGSVCRRLRLAKSGSTSQPDQSVNGTGTGRTSDSSKSLNVVDDITGREARIPVEYGDHRVLTVKETGRIVDHVHVVCGDKRHTDYGCCFTCGMRWNI